MPHGRTLKVSSRIAIALLKTSLCVWHWWLVHQCEALEGTFARRVSSGRSKQRPYNAFNRTIPNPYLPALYAQAGSP
jgi:hypothetical protein